MSETRGSPLTTPPKVSSINVDELLADIEGRPAVSLAELGARLGWDRQARAHAMREGLLETVPGRPAGGLARMAPIR
jgi:hypothetical protein